MPKSCPFQNSTHPLSKVAKLLGKVEALEAAAERGPTSKIDFKEKSN